MQLATLESQVQRVAYSIGSRVARLHEALHHLATLTAALFEATPRDEDAIAGWLEREGFAVDPAGGFFERAPHLARLRACAAAGTRPDPPTDPLSFLWPPSRRDDPVTRAHMHALRDAGPGLRALHARFPDVVWIYYQDDTNAAVIAPALDGVTAIPPEFDWHGYHSFAVAEPGHNPEGTIRWSPPNIDYGGRGLILCASIPVRHGDAFVGVWSMDVPLDSLLGDALRASPAGESFIVDYDGALVAHPAIPAVIAQEAGSVFRERLSALGGGFAGLDLGPLIAAGEGQIELVDRTGEPVMLLVRAVPEIRWLLMSAIPTAQLTAAGTRAIQEALRRVGEGDLSIRLAGDDEDELGLLARSYNAMAARLEAAVSARAAAEAALHEQLEHVHRQRAEIEALSSPVIEVGEGALVVPLIGALQPERMGTAIERVLSEVTRVRAQVVVLDLTGAQDVDAAALAGITGLVRAVGLLGARCVLSGLSPATASVLADTGTTERIECHATLKAALAARRARVR
ncbi:STAS domain-containing protein [Nannocystis sp. SCPEA4]|uniref:STAS domain-containing protein n=1 Tax=Nannocystis sp. SCPEA4 TaxID=2996787 RepID=UPI00226D6769|nr:HAMP domain-containing protein [Nannocystis sp. SCPEA4]